MEYVKKRENTQCVFQSILEPQQKCTESSKCVLLLIFMCFEIMCVRVYVIDKFDQNVLLDTTNLVSKSTFQDRTLAMWLTTWCDTTPIHK